MSYGTGGGASHVALKDGLLEDLMENTSDILIVAGGGGGGGLFGTTPGNAGGYIGGSPKLGDTVVADRSGTQSTGYIFGRGESGSDSPGAGGGFYGGLAGKTGIAGSGSGSGYIGNSLLTGDKKMIGYGVAETQTAGMTTYSRETRSSTPIANKTKMGNGYVKITYVQSVQPN